MKQYLPVGLAIAMSAILFAAFNSSAFWNLFAQPQYERVRIIDREPGRNGAQMLTVRLNSQIEVPLHLAKSADLHPDAQYLCAGLIGDPKDASVKAKYADLSKCPLPISRTLPQSGKVKTTTGSRGTARVRSLSVNSTSGSPGGQFPKSNIGFSNDR